MRDTRRGAHRVKRFRTNDVLVWVGICLVVLALGLMIATLITMVVSGPAGTDSLPAPRPQSAPVAP